MVAEYGARANQVDLRNDWAWPPPASHWENPINAANELGQSGTLGGFGLARRLRITMA